MPFRFPSFLILAAAALTFGSQTSQAQQPGQDTEYHAWWKENFGGWPHKDPRATLLPLIRVNGNRFVNAQGNPILLRGVSIADPDKIDHEGHWSLELFRQVKNMGATIVRIPVHPVSWRERGQVKYLELLDSAAYWCAGLGMYLIIDWHSIGNLEMELFQDPMYNTSRKETYEFWRTMARHFNGNNTVAFFEIFNEPTSYRGQLGNVSWDQWKKINEDIIQMIRAYDTQTIPLVAGFDWAYDLTPLREAPINAQNIGYVTHPYPNKRPQPWEPRWDEDFGFAAANYPLIATEIGFSSTPTSPDGADHYGARITTYLESHGISWVAWVFDPEWGPQMLKSWNFDLTGAGEFFKSVMQKPPAK